MNNKIPDYIPEIILNKGDSVEKTIVAVRGDLAESGESLDTWVLFDSNSFFVIKGHEKIDKRRDSRRIGITFELLDYQKFQNKLMCNLSVERFLSSARLVGEYDGEAVEICCFSMGFCASFDRLARMFKKFVHNEGDDTPIIEEELTCPKCGTRYPEPDRKICPKCMDKVSISKRLLSHFGHYKKQMIIIIILMLLTTVFNILSPYVGTKLLFDDVLTEDGGLFGMVAFVVAAIFLVRLGSLLLGILYSHTLAGIIPWVIYDIKLKIFTAMQKLSVGFYTSKQTGSLMSRVNDDSNNIYWFFVDGLPYVIVNVITFIGVISMMLMMSWQLALITIVIIPVVVISFRSMEKIFRAMHHHNWVYSSTLASFLSDSIKGQRIIRAHSREEQESERFADMSYRMSDAQLKLAVTENTFFPLIYLFMFVAQIIVTAVGGIMVLNGTLQVGTLLTFIVYLGMLYGPLEFMSWGSTWWSRCVDSAQRMFEIIDAKADVADCENPHILENMQGEITMEHVYFEYEPARPIIKDMSIHVKPGQMLGIVGKAGAGKSTMANLIARLYDAKEGSIFIDGINVKDIKIENLRRNVGVVSQEIYLFIGTIADNIKYSRPDASIDEVIAAAKAASAHEFIIKLPDGYETQVGAGGQDLSGGERQRLSIARTIIQNPKILILDEATAAMDTETERNIQNSLNKLKSGRTTLAIAHRLSTLKDADYLVVIDGGKIAEYGTHMDLIKKKGEYYNLFKIQSEALRHISIGE